MSFAMGDRAGWEAGPVATVLRQVFTSVPKIPSHINLHGKTALVTGASAGLGVECARHFLQLGVNHLILTMRSSSKGEAVEKRLRTEFPKSNIEFWSLDMDTYDAVREFAVRCESLERLDVVVLNAGGGKATFHRAQGGEGREWTLHVNYLATMLLAILLIPIIKTKTRAAAAAAGQSPPSPGRLLTISSDVALWVKMKEPKGSIFDALDSPKDFDTFDQYGKAKLLMMMFVAKLAEVVSAEDVIISTCHQGAVKNTELLRDIQGQYMTQAFIFFTNLFLGRNAVDGARTYVHSALVLGKESHGSFVNWEIMPYAPFVYTDVGRRMTEKLWDETLQELQITSIEAILGK